MARQVKLKAQRREDTGRSAVRKLKARDIVPAIIYGGKEKPQPLQVSARDVRAMLSHASGENILVELEIDGEKSNRLAMVQEIQHSPVGGDVLHLDFHAVSMDETIHADMPLEAVGPPKLRLVRKSSLRRSRRKAKPPLRQQRPHRQRKKSRRNKLPTAGRHHYRRFASASPC